MSNDINIFDSAKPQGGEFVKFKVVGDSIQGIYIDVRQGTDSFGNQQTIYVIQDAEGKIWNLGFRATALVIHERMNTIHFGQIVGFRFDEERESKKNPGTKVKIIRIYADAKLVDNAWLARQKEIEQTFGSAPSHSSAMASVPATEFRPTAEAIDEKTFPFKAPEDASAMAGGLPKAEAKPRNEAIDAIRNLAKTKGLTNGTMPEEEADHIIQQYTGLVLEEVNLTKIIIALTAYVSK